jgi:ABC-type lipoprotein release transport system permease subunit
MEIATPEYVEKPMLDYAITDAHPIIDAVKEIPGVVAYAPRLSTFGLVSYGDNSQGAAIIGVDPELEAEFGRIDDAILEGGTFLQDGDETGVVLGAKLARNIDVDVGDEILIVTSNRFNSLSYLGPLPIAGIVKTSVPDIDGTSLFINREILAREIFVDESVVYTNPDAEIKDISGVVTTVSISVEDNDKMEEIQAAIRDKLPEGTIIRNWREINPWIDQTFEMRVQFGYIVLFIVLLIVIAGILNTVLMSVMERTREFGIMRALGTKARQIFLTVSLESIMLGLIGILVGSIIGAGLTTLFGYTGMDIYGSLDESIMGQFYLFDTVLYPKLNIDRLFITCGIILLAVIVVSLYPARKASRMEPVSAIKALG